MIFLLFTTGATEGYAERRARERMAAMKRKRDRTTVDKVMIAVLGFAIALIAALAAFDAVSMATHTFDPRTGTEALVGSAIFVLICYRALRKRMNGLAK